eukprot:1993424-Amphidinium_carterae.1
MAILQTWRPFHTTPTTSSNLVPRRAMLHTHVSLTTIHLQRTGVTAVSIESLRATCAGTMYMVDSAKVQSNKQGV